METVSASVKKLIARQSEKAVANKKLYIGYVLLAFSAALFALTEYVNNDDGRLFLFILHYAIALAYAVVLFRFNVYGIRKSFLAKNSSYTIVLLHLFLVSAYALNRNLNVFDNSAPWMCAYLIITSFALLLLHFQYQLPKWLRTILYFQTGSSIIFYVYLIIYLLPWSLLGGIGIIFLGIGAHTFVPLCMLIAIILFVVFRIRSQSARHWVYAGAGITVIFALAFTVEWNARIKQVEHITSRSVLAPHDELPQWVRVAQSIPNDWITKRLIKDHLVYSVRPDFFDFGFRGSGRLWSARREHDPLVFIAASIKSLQLPEEDRIRILKALASEDHRAEERLWRGDDLVTSNIVTDIDLYPDLRIAYTEKYLTINNQNKNTWASTRPQEAIYTFQLPPGSVVTSLSLWINGKEEKAILTSKQKATQAYQTIVGVEARDPSVVHWREGNTISVRVFPCTPSEPRRFKIGVTSPLIQRGDRIKYQNISFEGPSANSASEIARITVMGENKIHNLPARFKAVKANEFYLEDNFNPNLDLSFDAVPVRDNNFSFDGYQYELAVYTPTDVKVDYKRVYLDVNNTWSDYELKKSRELLEHHNLYACKDGQLIQINEENWRDIIEPLHKQTFSMFPFYKIGDTSTSLVVTKGSMTSPHLADLKNTGFAKSLSSFFRSGNKIFVYNLSSAQGNYLQSLGELRALQFADGDILQLNRLLMSKTFPIVGENDGDVVLREAGLRITKKRLEGSALKTISNAPDHLARLFAYNNIMRKVGEYYFSNDMTAADLVSEATKAYVVSPVSSLIVLETKADYERFNIHDSQNSLQNASKNSFGAVPEPHEWALIIMFLLLIVFTLTKNLKWTI